jgi:hypothetical protein
MATHTVVVGITREWEHKASRNISKTPDSIRVRDQTKVSTNAGLMGSKDITIGVLAGSLAPSM